MEVPDPTEIEITFEQHNPSPKAEFYFSNPTKLAELIVYAVRQNLRIDTFPEDMKVIVALPYPSCLHYCSSRVLKADTLNFSGFEELKLTSAANRDGVTMMEQFTFPVFGDTPVQEDSYVSATYADDRYTIPVTAAELLVQYRSPDAFRRFTDAFPAALPSGQNEATLNLDIWNEIFAVSCSGRINGISVDCPVNATVSLHRQGRNYKKTIAFDLLNGGNVFRDLVLEPNPTNGTYY